MADHVIDTKIQQKKTNAAPVCVTLLSQVVLSYLLSKV